MATATNSAFGVTASFAIDLGRNATAHYKRTNSLQKLLRNYRANFKIFGCYHSLRCMIRREAISVEHHPEPTPWTRMIYHQLFFGSCSKATAFPLQLRLRVVSNLLIHAEMYATCPWKRVPDHLEPVEREGREQFATADRRSTFPKRALATCPERRPTTPSSTAEAPHIANRPLPRRRRPDSLLRLHRRVAGESDARVIRLPRPRPLPRRLSAMRHG